MIGISYVLTFAIGMSVGAVIILVFGKEDDGT